jgi:hypothetical protein
VAAWADSVKSIGVARDITAAALAKSLTCILITLNQFESMENNST